MTTLSPDYPSGNTDHVCLWDMDGTLCDYDFAMQTRLMEMRSPDETWSGRAHDVDTPWMRARIRSVRNTPGFWRDLPWVNRGRHLIDAFARFGFENHILTKGPSTVLAWSEKIEWCAKHVPDFYRHVSDKKSLVYGKVLVDDWPGYFFPWLDAHPKGMVVAVGHPWNKGTAHPRLIRYTDNLEEVVERVESHIQS